MKKLSQPKKWVTITKQVADNITPEQTRSLLEAIRQEIGELKLDVQAREELRRQLGSDETASNGWKTVDDVLSHIDIVDFAAKHPEAIKNAVSSALTIVGSFFPVIAPAAGAASVAVAQMPDSVAAKFVQYGRILTPEHLVHSAAKALANRQDPAAAENGDIVLTEAEKTDNDPSTELIAVCKDPVLMSLLQDLVETNGDRNKEHDAGTGDGGISVIALNEKAWTAGQRENIIDGKVLFIGDVKGSDDLLKRIDVKYDRLGIQYGWCGNRALITASAKEIKENEKYLELLSALQELPIREKYKSNSKFKFDAAAVGKLLLATPLLLKDGYDEAVALKRQQLILGIYEMYKHDLATFMAE